MSATCQRSVRRPRTPALEDNGPSGGADLRSCGPCGKPAVAIYREVVHNPEAHAMQLRVCSGCQNAISWQKSRWEFVAVILGGPFDGKWSKVETFENGQPTSKSFVQLIGEALEGK